MSTTIELICAQCNKKFEKTTKEYRRQIKLGRTENKWFCGLKCNAVHRNTHRSQETQEKISAAVGRRSKGNAYSKKGDFTYYLNMTKHRKTKKGDNREFDLDESYLARLWAEQKGKCVYSGLNMVLKTRGATKLPNIASLDRIDSTKGYVKGNVHFVCYSLNLAKNDFDDDTFRNFLYQLSKKKVRLWHQELRLQEMRKRQQ